jgi:hypothetical protein
MTYWSADILGKNTQLFPLTFGEILVRWLKQKHPYSSLAKMAESRFGLDPKTSRNLVSEQVCSSTTLLRSVLTEQERTRDGWALWDAIGELLLGETRAQYDERKLSAMIEALNAQQQVASLRARRERLEAEASALVDMGSGQPPSSGRGEAGDRRRFADGLGR